MIYRQSKLAEITNKRGKMSYQDQGYSIQNVITKMDCQAIIGLALPLADEEFKPIVNIHKQENLLEEVIIRDYIILEAVQNALGGEVECIGTMFHYKKPGTFYGKQAWNPHQDNSYIQADSNAYLSAIISLVDTDEDNGGLYVYPGSHKEPILPYIPTPTYCEKPGNKVIDIPKHYRKKDLKFKAGDLYLQHGNLIHGSYPNKSKKPRYHLGIMYLVRGKSYSKGGARAK